MMDKITFLCLVCQIFSTINAIPTSTQSWVTVPNEGKESIGSEKKDNGNQDPKTPEIYSMKVEANVTNRFTKTLVTSKVRNLGNTSQEVIFSAILPETAYITGFIMEIDGKKYEAYIQEKEEAKKTYDQAVSSGLSAGHVAVSARDSNIFTVSVNVESRSKATFYLKYEELLKRVNGQYEIVTNLHPGQIVEDFEVQVNINETRRLTSLKVPSLRTGNEISKNDEKLDPKVEITKIGETAAKIIFKPDAEKQKELGLNLGKKENEGISGQFVAQYDVERDPTGGEVLVSDGYFVHFFAPTELKPLPKHVVFILDTSGSMWGTRIKQLKEAMKSILDQLKDEDSFNLIDFNSDVKVWDIPNVKVQYKKEDHYYWGPSTPKAEKPTQTLPGSFEVSKTNIKQAKKVVDEFEATGGTDIYSAFNIGLELLKKNVNKDEKQPIIMFLTDGDPTTGETDTDKIIAKVLEENTLKVPVFSLSFGDGADKAFLEKISLKNQGFARHIYEGADASLQLESFYKYISSPLLKDVSFKYTNTSSDETKITLTNFPIFFDGSELVVAGKYDKAIIDAGFAPAVNCFIGRERKEYKPKYEHSVVNLEKHWAYLTLKQLLDKRDAADNKTQLTKEALDLALKYSFVTPVSSLVVVKPNNTKSETNPQDASKGEQFPIQPSYSLPGGSYPNNRVYAMAAPAYGYRPRLGLSAQGIHALSASNAFTTPYFPPAYPSTTELDDPDSFKVSIDHMKAINLDDFDTLKMGLPWLKSISKPVEKSILLPQGEFVLVSATLITEVPQCSNSVESKNGTCVLLSECPQVYTHLKDLHTYSQHFCPIQQKYAGVCCPISADEVLRQRGIVTPIP